MPNMIVLNLRALRFRANWIRGLAFTALISALSPGSAYAADPKASQLYEDALQRFEKQDYPGSIIQLKNALQIDKSALPVHVLLGKALLARGEVVAAQAAFEEALRLGVSRSEVVVPLATAVLGQARPQDLLDQDRFATSGLPAAIKAELLVLKARAETDRGDLRTALKLAEDAREADASNVGAWLVEVPIRLRSRQASEAVAAANRALALAPTSAEANYLRGTIAHEQADLATALAWYEKALRLDSTHLEAMVSRAGLLVDLNNLEAAAKAVALLRSTAADDPRGAYLSALLAERRGDSRSAREALATVTALLDRVPIEFMRYRTQLLVLGGLAHFGLHEVEKARPYLEAAYRGQPQSPAGKVLAQIYLADKNYDSAIQVLDAYLRGHPDDVQAKRLLASVHLAQGRHARAAAISQEALGRQESPATRTLLGLSLIGAGKYADALNELEAAFARDASQVQAGSALVALYLQGGQAQKALRIADTLARRNPASPGVQNLLGTTRLAAQDLRGAQQAFEASLKLNPELAAAQLGMARLEIRQQAFDKAAARLSNVLTKNDGNVEAMIELAGVNRLMGQVAEAQRWLEKADDRSGTSTRAGLELVALHLATGRADLGREAVKRLTSKAPEDHDVLMASARVALAVGDKSEAKSILVRAAGLAGFDAARLVDVAILQLQAGQLADASHSLDKALSARPGFLPATLVLADVDIRRGEYAKAEQLARKVMADHPSLGVGHALMGDLAMARNQPQAAVAAYRRAHEQERTSASVLRLFGALTRSDPKAANQLAERWLRDNARDTKVMRAWADSLAREGNLASARRAYESLVKTSPGDADGLNNLANVMLLQEDPGALEMANRALSLKPESPLIQGTAGWAAFKAGQPDRALQLLREARLRNPSNPDTRYFLAAVLAHTGKKKEARDEVEGALKLPAPGFANARNAAELLKTLN